MLVENLKRGMTISVEFAHYRAAGADSQLFRLGDRSLCQRLERLEPGCLHANGDERRAAIQRYWARIGHGSGFIEAESRPVKPA
jgi:hypothetical protein